MIERIVEFTPRKQECRAVLHDDGRNEQHVPVCMGGISLIGCNHYSECGPVYGERVANDDITPFVIRDESNSEIVTATFNL